MPVFGLLFLAISFSFAQKTKPVEPPKPIFKGKDGKMAYTADELGNRIPDFSYAGYMAGEKAIPNVAIKVVVPVSKGDATLRIQSAINYVSKLAAGKDGFRGAVLLEKGTYEIAGTLKLSTSGVILRGSGFGENGTRLFATRLDRIGVIRILGKNNKVEEKPVAITDNYVPVNSNKVTLNNSSGFKVGDRITINRPSTKEWIETLKTVEFGGGESALGWKPGTRDIHWDRKILAINGSTITFDAPITTALDSKFGGATVAKYQWEGRIAQSGVENLKLESDFHKDNVKDEYHRWTAICLENVEDAWVRQVVFEHFAGSAVNVLETAKRITVEDCKSLAPVSEIGGERRYTFLTTGQQTLFQRLYSEYAYHDFAVGFCAPGPNVFLQCQSYLPFSFSGTIDSWASGVLFDIVNVDGQALSFLNRGQDG
ncbi:MAG: pectate lyase, partial [Sphingobacteriales bacterium]